jgi:hypothetical protein
LVDTQHGRNPSPIGGGYSSFIELDVFDGIGVKNREKPKQVGGVKDGSLVE